jgi:hypothetical protein
MSVADYVGRQVDMFAFRGMFPAALGSEQLLAQELVQASDGGELVAGIEKMAQEILLILLTPVGSRIYAPTEGTTFMIDAAQGYWRTVADVSQSYYTASLAVSRQYQALQTAADPLDEQWGSLTLLGVVLSGTAVSIQLQLISAAGTTYTFLTPITVPLISATDY